MNCRLWSMACKTFVIAAVFACAFDIQASVVGQENDLVDLDGVSTRNVRSLANENVVEDLASVDSDDLQVAPSPKKKSSTSASRGQKKRTGSKQTRKLNVPATLGATKSTRKSEKELDQIFASRSKLAPDYIQYAPSAPGANAAAQDSYGVGSYEDSKQTLKAADSRSFITNAPYVEQIGKIQQTNALSQGKVEPTAPERYPLFEEDALTQESMSLNDELNFTPSENTGAAPERSESTPNGSASKDGDVKTPEAPNPFVENTREKSKDYLPTTTSKVAHDEFTAPFASPWSTDSFGKVVKPTGVFENRFTRFTGIFADVEWLGWQTDSMKQNYAISVTGSNHIYDELSLTPSGTGYRGRFGLRTINGWDLTCAYTTFEADKDGNVREDEGKLYTVSGTNVDEISARADVDLDIYDVEVGRWITREGWAARPFAGARWARLNQTQSVGSWNNLVVETQNGNLFASFDDAASTESVVVSDYESVFARSQSDMYGLRVGVEGNVALFRNLSAYGRGAATIAVGDASYQTISNSEQDELSVIKRAEKSYSTPALETAVGLVWRRGGLEVKGGYELNVFSNASYLNGKSSDFVARGFFAGVAWNN